MGEYDMVTHEDLDRKAPPLPGSSNRSFGIIFTVFFVVVGLWPSIRGGPVRTWALGLSGLFLIATLLWPPILTPLNRLWSRLGLLLHRVTNPVIMGLMFYGVLTPMGVVMRRLGRDPLRRRFEPDAQSYWIDRRPPGPAPQTMTNQF